MVLRLAAASFNCKLGQANSQTPDLPNQNCLDQVFGLINPPGDSEAQGLRVTAAMEQDFGELSRGLSKFPLCKVKQAKENFIQGSCNNGGRPALRLNSTPLDQRAERFYFFISFSF